MPFFIQWHSKRRGTGHGPAIESKEVAEKLCADLNDEYPEEKHEVIEVNYEQHKTQTPRESKCQIRA
jgi:hypothetical protein